MIIKLTKEEITEAVLEYVDRRVNTDFSSFNSVEFKYSTPWDGCEISWIEPGDHHEPEAT